MKISSKLLNRRMQGIKVSRTAIESLSKAGQVNRAPYLYARSFGDLESYLEACKAPPYFGSKRVLRA